MPRKSIDRSTSGSGNVIDLKTGKLVEKPKLPVICERIQYFRSRSGMEQKELAARIGITANAISNWETGRSRPDINLVPAICDALDISLYELYDMEEPGIKYTAKEQLLMDRYQTLSPGHKHVVDNLVDSLIDAEYAESCPAIKVLDFFERSLAAGIGDPTVFEEQAIPIYLYADQISPLADSVFQVNGDSMEPAFYNGDLVLVERILNGTDLQYGDIGAFIVGNETYIKRYEKNGLYSLNKKYKPLFFKGDTDVYLIGKVIEKLDTSSIARDTDVEKYTRIHGE